MSTSTCFCGTTFQGRCGCLSVVGHLPAGERRINVKPAMIYSMCTLGWPSAAGPLYFVSTVLAIKILGGFGYGGQIVSKRTRTGEAKECSELAWTRQRSGKGGRFMDMARAVAAIRGCSKTRWGIAQRIGEWKGSPSTRSSDRAGSRCFAALGRKWV